MLFKDTGINYLQNLNQRKVFSLIHRNVLLFKIVTNTILYFFMKARTVKEVKKFQDIPNIGPAMERDFVLIDLKNPKDLQGKDPLALYKKICHIRGVRQDPCVLDVYMAAVDFMNGKPAHPWWHYTKIRKKKYPNL